MNDMKKVITGNLKKQKSGTSVNIYLTNEQVKKLDKICEETGAIKNRYVGEALDHYWKCKK